eukprot:scaffold369_cov281-Pinguiococcus_pyrenoidosus.AAC.3
MARTGEVCDLLSNSGGVCPNWVHPAVGSTTSMRTLIVPALQPLFSSSSAALQRMRSSNVGGRGHGRCGPGGPPP